MESLQFEELYGSQYLVLGNHDIAYIKRILVDGQYYYAIHAADGTELAVVNNREVAFATARQHDMEPLSVH